MQPSVALALAKSLITENTFIVSVSTSRSDADENKYSKKVAPQY